MLRSELYSHCSEWRCPDWQLFIKYTSLLPFYVAAVIEWYVLLRGSVICAWAIRHLKCERLIIYSDTIANFLHDEAIVMHLSSITIPLHCIRGVVLWWYHYNSEIFNYATKCECILILTLLPLLLCIIVYHTVQCWLLRTLYIISFIVITLHGLSSYYQHNRFRIFGYKYTFAFCDFNHVPLDEMCCITTVFYALTIYFYCNRRPFINHRTESISLVRI